MNEYPAGEPRLNPDGGNGPGEPATGNAQHLAREAARRTADAARATKTSFVSVFRVWAGIAPDPVGRAPDAVAAVSPGIAWQSLGWVALLYALTLPRIEQTMLPLLMRSHRIWPAVAFHAVALCVGLTAAAFGLGRLFGGRLTIEKCAFAVSLALLPQWIALSFAGWFFGWTHTWVFGVVGIGASIALFLLYAVFTRAFGLSDARATLAVPLALGLGGGAAFYLAKIAS